MGAEVSVDEKVTTGPRRSNQYQYQYQHERFSEEKSGGRGGRRGGNRNQNQRGGGGPKQHYQNRGNRDPSPSGSETQNRGPPDQPRKPKNDFGRGKNNQPPKYEEAVKQNRDDKEKVQKNLSSRKQNNDKGGSGPQLKKTQNVPSSSNLGNAKTVDALNDLVKKEFGSVGGPTHNLPAINMAEKPFSGRNCLYVGNLPEDISRQEVNALMATYGDVTVDYYNPDKKFAFIRLKHREQAENAQRNLDGYVLKGRTIKVRLSSNTARFKVLNLTPWVTNELLKKAFTSFGEVERAEIIIEDGKPTGEGYIEFSDKRAGQAALEACVENCFLLTSSLRPIILEEIDPDNGLRGYSERQLPRNNNECSKARQVGPRFLAEGSSEYACALLWKNFVERRRKEEEELEEKFRLEEEHLEARIETLFRAEQSLFQK